MTWPGLAMVIAPPHAHMQVLLAVRTGSPLIEAFGEPGDHGAVMTGMQGWGVRTPRAADVAAATCGLDGVMHMRKGMMFVMGAMSAIFATG